MPLGQINKIPIYIIAEKRLRHDQWLRNDTGTSAVADVSYLMADVEADFLYKSVLNTTQNAVIGQCWWIEFGKIQNICH